jgi:ornithine carbamoyltransferase
MAYHLKNRSLSSLDELNARDIQHLLEMSHELKRAKAAGTEQPALRGRNIALLSDLLSERSSSRTRAFEVAARDQGAQVSFIGPGDSPLGEKESVKDTARVLGRLYDAIEYRGSAPQTAKELAAHAGVPVYHGLTDEFHPTQVLADLMTMQEHCDKPLREMRVAWLGDARGNTGDSLLQGAALLGMDLRIAAPRALWPAAQTLARCEALARVSGARLAVTEAALQAVEGVDFIDSGAWAAAGEPEAAWAERIALLRPYQVNARLMAAAGHASVKFMHGLPAFHHRELEVTEEVFESPASIVWDQAENRLHTIKAVLVSTLG